ncbi:MAG: hypothetical protein AB7E79_04290 [Rhodospirillaceae bacterium]
MFKSFLIGAALTVSSACLAQTPPASGDPLKEICTGFLAQSGAGISGDQYKLCACLVAETQKRLTRQEMEIYDKAVSSATQPPPAIMEKVMGIATTCLTQAR